MSGEFCAAQFPLRGASHKYQKESAQVASFLPGFLSVSILQTRYKLLVYSLENEINFASTFALIAREMFSIRAYEGGELALAKAERAHLEITRLLLQIRSLENDTAELQLHSATAPEGMGCRADSHSGAV